jgi:hypothetical protein
MLVPYNFYTQQLGDEKDMPRVKCIKCGEIGNLTIKKTKSHGTAYEYYYVQHYIKENDKIRWCYLGKYESLPTEYKEILQKEKVIHNNIQNNSSTEKLNLRLVNENKQGNNRAGSLARLGHLLDVQKVAGSNPARPTPFRLRSFFWACFSFPF